MDQERTDLPIRVKATRTQAVPLSLLGTSFEAAPNGLLVIDEQATVVAANAALLRMFGYEASGLIGQALEVLVPGQLRQGHVALRTAFVKSPQRRAMGSGRELHARHSSGRAFPVEIGLNPMSTPQGQLVLASVVDTSQRRNLEAAFARIFESAMQGMALVDARGCIALLNDRLAAMLGYRPADLVGRHLDVLLPERYRPVHAGLMAGYREAPSTRSMGVGRDLTALHAGGTELPVEIGLSEVNWQGQQMTLTTVIDISVRRRIEIELRQANENLREFTHVASHDLRSPLRGIADLVSWVREDLGAAPPPRLVHNLDRIGERVQRLDRLIGDLLRYARCETANSDCTPIDLAELVDGILRVDPLPDGFDLAWELDTLALTAPRTPLETAVRNLLGNAVKHHDRDTGRITVAARTEGGYCRISVTDDGPGIAPAAQERVFRLFQTAGAAERAGSGLGLALSKRIVEVHAGRIALESPVANGRGARFEIWWPSVPRKVHCD